MENMLSVITDDSLLPPGKFADTESSVFYLLRLVLIIQLKIRQIVE